ncbi:DUF2185 domain-containing protein [Pseudomonas aeruginosa]|nr:DUF2185 domain-containing protein [Pseudomonas aeruginosa]
MASWTLVDASAIAVRHPYTFYKPDAETIDRVAAGESVKLIFAFDTDNPDAPRAERLWVTVEGIEADGAQRPPGQLSAIHPRPVAGRAHRLRGAAIINTEHDPRETPTRIARRCFVTRRVIDEGKAVGYLYREAPEEENDSGWRLMAGDESDDYMNTAGTTAYVSLGSVLNADDSILPLLDAPPGRAFERLADGSFHRGAGTGGLSLSQAARRGSAPGARPGPGSRRDCGCCPSFPT